MSVAIMQPYQLFVNVNGLPLQDGYIYIGEEGEDAESSPVPVFWDKELTTPATQPIRTRGGFPANGNTIGILYTEDDYSITIKNSNGDILQDALTQTSAVDLDDIDYLFNAAGAEVRTLQSRLDDIISVKNFGAVGDNVADDTVAIQTAINYCFTNQFRLFWPAGSYKTTQSIQHLHETKNMGEGVITRAGFGFFVDPDDNDNNTLYVSTAAGGGDDNNDGITPSQPFLTLQAACVAINGHDSPVRGNWRILIDGNNGQYAQFNTVIGVQTKNLITIQGSGSGHPTVPSTVFNGVTGGANDKGFIVSNKCKVYFIDITFINFTGAGQRNMISVKDGSDVIAQNVHAQGCNDSVYFVSEDSTLKTRGGICLNVAGGIRSEDSNIIVGFNNNNLSQGTQFISTGVGTCFDLKNSFAQISYPTVDFFAKGVSAKNSTVLTNSIDFRRNALCFETVGNGVIDFGVPNIYNDGASTENTVKFINGAYGGISDIINANSASDIRISKTKTPVTRTGSGAQTFPAFYTIPAYTFFGGNKDLRIKINGFATNFSSGSTFIISVGGISVNATTTILISNKYFFVDAVFMELNSGVYSLFSQMYIDTFTFSNGATGAFNKTIANNVQLSLNSLSSSDSITVNSVEIYQVA